MELTLEQCIQYLLYRDQKLTLPGIGVLSVKRQPAQFSSQRTELLPPTFKLIFDERIDDPYTTLPKAYETIYNAEAEELQECHPGKWKSRFIWTWKSDPRWPTGSI